MSGRVRRRSSSRSRASASPAFAAREGSSVGTPGIEVPPVVVAAAPTTTSLSTPTRNLNSRLSVLPRLIRSSDNMQPPVPPVVYPRVLYEPEGELIFWHKMLGWILSPVRPNFVSTFMQFLFVAPYTNVTNFALFYQQYLNELVHRKFGTRFFHHLCSPFILVALWTCFGQYSLFQTDLCLYDHCVHVDGNGTFVLFWIFTVWYTLWGFAARPIEQVRLLGLINLLPNFAIYSLATKWWAMYGATGNHSWYSPTTTWWSNPFVVCAVLSVVQSFSHAFEDHLPPRTTEYGFWVNIKQYFQSAPLGLRIIYMFQGAINALWGAIDEFLVTPRLQPLYMLEYVRLITGYKKEQYDYLMGFVNKAISPAEGNDAALDFIGTGGGLYLWQVKQVDGSTIKPLWPDLSGRMFDWFFVFLFTILFVVSYTVDVIPALAPVGIITREWASTMIWPPKFSYNLFFWYTENFDPITLNNSLSAKLMSVVSPVFWGPLYAFAVYSFIMGNNRIRASLLCWAGAASMSVGVLYTMLMFGGPGVATSNPLAVTLFWSPYLLGIPLTMKRMWNTPFPVQGVNHDL